MIDLDSKSVERPLDEIEVKSSLGGETSIVTYLLPLTLSNARPDQAKKVRNGMWGGSLRFDSDYPLTDVVAVVSSSSIERLEEEEGMGKR